MTAYRPIRLKEPKKKYHSNFTEVDGIKFRSKLEAKRYGELKMLERAGKIDMLVLQPRYPMQINGVKIVTYVADFSYVDLENNRLITEDTKGCVTDLYRVKRQLFRALYPHLKLVEVTT